MDGYVNATTSETMILDATRLTVEFDFDFVHRQEAIALVKFPNPDPDGDRVLITGSVGDLRDVVNAMSKLLDDLEEEHP
jgi:hypothetical protein